MLNEMERLALKMLLAGDSEELAVFRAQLNGATVASREFTGVGFFTHLSVPAELPRARNRDRLVLSDLYAEVSGLEHDAGFVLFGDGPIDENELGRTLERFRIRTAHAPGPVVCGRGAENGDRGHTRCSD